MLDAPANSWMNMLTENSHNTKSLFDLIDVIDRLETKTNRKANNKQVQAVKAQTEKQAPPHANRIQEQGALAFDNNNNNNNNKPQIREVEQKQTNNESNPVREYLSLIAIMVGIIVVVIIIRCIIDRYSYINRLPSYSIKVPVWSHRFRTGDLLLTSTSNIYAVSKMLCKTSINHVGVVYVEPLTGHVYVWEMTTRGTRLASLNSLLDQLKKNDRILVRPLLYNGKLVDIDNNRMEKSMYETWDRTFNWDIGMATYNRFWSLVPVMRGFWGYENQRSCSHLATEVYHHLGVMDLSESRDPTSLLPVDFTEENSSVKKQALPFVTGYKFGRTILLSK
jgi:hypothetical protein